MSAALLSADTSTALADSLTEPRSWRRGCLTALAAACRKLRREKGFAVAFVASGCTDAVFAELRAAQREPTAGSAPAAASPEARGPCLLCGFPLSLHLSCTTADSEHRLGLPLAGLDSTCRCLSQQCKLLTVPPLPRSASARAGLLPNHHQHKRQQRGPRRLCKPRKPAWTSCAPWRATQRPSRLTTSAR